MPLLESLWRDLAQGLRQLRRHPGFALAGITILGLGIAATTAIFSIAYGVLLRDLPYDLPSRLVSINATMPKAGLPRAFAGASDYFDFRRDQQVFEDMSLTRAVGNYNLSGDGEPERLQGARTTPSLFSTLRAAPLLGRVFTEAERADPAQADRLVVLSHGLWKRRFASDPAIIGRRISLNGTPHEVIGVMRPEFQYPTAEFELWTPLYIPPVELAARGDYSYRSVARLKPGVTLAGARAHMESLAARLGRDYPRTNQDVGVFVGPLLAELTASVSRSLWVLVAAVGTLFLIGCVNLANLLLARAANRSRELAVRASLGATRPRLARQFFAETIPLAAAGVAIGFLAARVLLRLLIPFLPAGMPRVEEIGLHGPVLLFSASVAACATFLVALAPAVSVRASIERGPAARGTMRDVLMVAEIAGTAVLLITSGLLIRSFANLSEVNPGFQPDRAWSMHLAVSRTKHGDDPGVARYLGRLIDRLRAVPGVDAVGIVNRLPMGGQSQMMSVRFEELPDTRVMVDSRSVNGGYFRSLGIPLVSGRTFDDNDTPRRTLVGIVDERLVRDVFGGRDPIGKRFRINAVGQPWVQVVGVVGHLLHNGLDQDPRGLIYWPYQQRTQDRMAIVVRGNGPNLAGAAREAIREVDPDQPLYDVRPMKEVVERTLSARWLSTVLIGAFAAMALLLAGIGLYGVVAYLTEQRRREFGIRIAIGASASQILAMVVKQGFTRVAAGLALGLALSFGVTRFLAALLHGVAPLDFVTYALAAFVLMAVMLIATMVPAWRAARTDPTLALRAE
jgi:putative ABC transport system permease protein